MIVSESLGVLEVIINYFKQRYKVISQCENLLIQSKKEEI